MSFVIILFSPRHLLQYVAIILSRIKYHDRMTLFIKYVFYVWRMYIAVFINDLKGKRLFILLKYTCMIIYVMYYNIEIV